MKTYKVFLKDYAFETINANNYAVDDQNNLVVGDNLFHRDDWKRIIFLYENAVENDGHYNDQTFQQEPYYYDNSIPTTGGYNTPSGQGILNSEW